MYGYLIDQSILGHEIRLKVWLTTIHLLFFRWIEKWLRRWRNVFCGHTTQISSSGVSILTGICQTTVRDLRSAQCSSSSSTKRKSVLQSLKTDLECDAFNKSSIFGSKWWLIILPTTISIFIQAFILWLDFDLGSIHKWCPNFWGLFWPPPSPLSEFYLLTPY